MRSRPLLVLSLVLVVLASACADKPRTHTNPSRGTALRGVKAANFLGLAWVGQSLILSKHPDKWQVLRVPEDGGPLALVEMPHEPECRRTDFLRPSRLPDGRLGLVKSCVLQTAKEGIDDLNSYVGTDVETGAIETLAPLAPAASRRVDDGIVEGDHYPATVSWNPTLTSALIDTEGSCTTLALLSKDGVASLNADIGDNGRQLSLSLGNRWQAEDCAAFISAFSPAWSPNGNEVAFFASPGTVGLAGPERLEQPANLYLMRPGEWKPRLLLSNVRFASDLQWSPDAHSLAFAGGVRGDDEGLWLVGSDGKALRQITPRSVSKLAWSPDGRRLAALVGVAASADLSEVRVFDAE